ncbi:MAG: hypothetical protein LBD86_03295 [Spirochaetaceae bacterium]|jgi:hypothetical protein|nr:hypothetical protein [Spirochaetaceae bacterium]
MLLFCTLWTFVFYLFWLAIRPEYSDSRPFWALLAGCAGALARLFIPAFVDAHGFGLSRFVSAFIDYTSIPVLFTLIAALLVSRFCPPGGVTDFTGFILLAMTPVSIACLILWDLRYDTLRLVLTPLFWTALALAAYPFACLFRKGLLHKMAAILGMAAFSLLPPLSWLEFFRHSYVKGAALLAASLAPLLVLSVLFYKKKADMEKVSIAGVTEAGSGKFAPAPRQAALKVRAFLKRRRRAAAAFCALLLVLAASADYFAHGLVRRSFVFRLIDTGQDIVEDRMLRSEDSRETNIRRYVEEALLGPLSPEAEALFDSGAKPGAVLLRDGDVFIDFSEEAALPPLSGRLADKFRILDAGIRRNFPFVRDVRVFIAGQEVKYF